MFNIAALAGLSNIAAIRKNFVNLCRESSSKLIPFSNFLNSSIIGSKKTLKSGFLFPIQIPFRDIFI
jgi:hypothetical protein